MGLCDVSWELGSRYVWALWFGCGYGFGWEITRLDDLKDNSTSFQIP